MNKPVQYERKFYDTFFEILLIWLTVQ